MVSKFLRVFIGGKDHFGIFFFDPHVSLATIRIQLDEHIFDIFLEKHYRQWKVQEYQPNFVALWKVEALLDIFLHPSEYFNEVYYHYLEANDMEEKIEQSWEEEED
ncbi:hypothetical protein Fot_53338 [Forsythia ovata]|uniref:Uncharacterized protein n=1 Tax=Forsythia ovata TaxID=205694 RepID=A0ABD1PID5_9LAMI